jgi:hypothetical protein
MKVAQHNNSKIKMQKSKLQFRMQNYPKGQANGASK